MARRTERGSLTLIELGWYVECGLGELNERKLDGRRFAITFSPCHSPPSNLRANHARLPSTLVPSCLAFPFLLFDIASSTPSPLSISFSSLSIPSYAAPRRATRSIESFFTCSRSPWRPMLASSPPSPTPNFPLIATSLAASSVEL